jgi:hypothetical protein
MSGVYGMCARMHAFIYESMYMYSSMYLYSMYGYIYVYVNVCKYFEYMRVYE